MDLLLINGPNLNLVGQREPSLYGLQTLNDIEKELLETANKLDVKLNFFQSNSNTNLKNYAQTIVTKSALLKVLFVKLKNTDFLRRLTNHHY